MENLKDAVKKQTNSLMRMTKAQLVEIILRKDDVEKTLRNKLTAITKQCFEDLGKAKEVIEDEHKHAEKIKSDFEEMSDYAATLEAEIKEERRKHRNTNNAVTCVTIAFTLYVLVSAYVVATML